MLLCAGLALAAPAYAEDLDLGPRPTNGPDAVSGLPARASAVVHEMACGDELEFLNRFAEMDFINRAPSATQENQEWPIGHLMAKAAFITGAYQVQVEGPGLGEALADYPDGTCVAIEPTADIEPWRGQFLAADDQEQFEGARQRWDAIQTAKRSNSYIALISAMNVGLQARYTALFGPACARPTAALLQRPLFGEPPVTFSLTPACLMAQIKVVVTHPGHGAWRIVEGKKVPRMPGTSAGKLPCPTDWALVNEGLWPGDWTMPWDGLKGVEGDWDMAVIEYTRLAHLIYRARAGREGGIATDADAALDKLNRWLLSLKGGTARELYHPFWSCGNPANSFGSAEDYVDDNDVYNQDLQQTVSGKEEGKSSFWKKLWKFLRFLIVVAAIAFAIGAVLGALTAGLGAALAAGAAAAAAALTAILLVIAFATMWVAGIEETENHLFMQNTSIYLKNKLMMAELKAAGNREGFDEIADKNEEVRKWLLHRMQRVVREDFVEYNSKPYSRLSHQAILNLADYACDVSWAWENSRQPPPSERGCDDRDHAVQTAAASVYDLSAAKVALGSNQGRRMIPFRRLMGENTQYRDTWLDEDYKKCPQGCPHPPKRFLDLGGGADHMLAALQLWAGTTQHGPGGMASDASLGQMLWHATSRYRPHEIILDLAVDKSTPLEQGFHYGGDEHYSSGPRWLLTAGGTSTHAAQGLRLNYGWLGLLGANFNLYAFSPTEDKGVGVPTSLTVAGTAARRDTYTELLRFEGKPEKWGNDGNKVMQSFSHNKCVTANFACGLRPEEPSAVRRCLQPVPDLTVPRNLRFLSSSACPEYVDNDGDPSNDFFLTTFRGVCRKGIHECDYNTWGFIEVTPASAFNGSFADYQKAVIDRNRVHFKRWTEDDGVSTLEFWSVARNQSISFQPYDEDFDEDCRACGAVVNGSDDGRFTITNPRRPGQSIVIDFTDEDNPRRRGEGGLSLGTP